MKTITISSDYHYKGFKELPINKEKIMSADLLLGDNYDIARCRKHDIPSLLSEIESDNSKYGIFKKMVWGNHEGYFPFDVPNVIVRNKTLFVHGHQLFYSDKKILKWKKKKGISDFKFQLFKLCYNKERKKNYKISTSTIQKAIEIMNSYYCNTIVFGHTHTSKLIDIKVDGYRIINVPRGITTLTLDI